MIAGVEYIQYQQIARTCLSPLFKDLVYLPQTGMSLDFHSLMILVNDVVINKRMSVLEFGSGISTIILANLIRTHKLQTKLWSVESDLGWQNAVKEWLAMSDLQDCVNLIHAPLEQIPDEDDFTVPWYKMSVLEETFADKQIDMVIVDGPPAFNAAIQYSRYPALFFILGKTAPAYSLFLHDTNRDGEKTVLFNWEEELKRKSQQFTQKLSGFLVGKSYNIHF